MARYIAIIGFNSKVNANQFSFNNPTLSPQNVEVTQGFTPSPGTVGQVAPGVSTPTTWVMVTSDSLNQLITATQGRPTSVTFDAQTNQIINNTNNIDPYSITVTQNQQEIFRNGILQTAPTPQPVPAVPQSLQDQITQFNLQTQNLLDQLNQYFTPLPPIVPVLPNSLLDQITKNQLIQQNLNDQLNLYFNPPTGAPIPAVPQSFQDQVEQFNLQTQNLLDQLEQFFTPPTDTPIPFQPIYDNPDLRKLLQRQMDQQEINRQLDQMLNPDQTQEDIVIPNVPPEPPISYPKYPYKDYDPQTDPLNPLKEDTPDFPTEPEPQPHSPIITPDPFFDPQMDITPLHKRETPPLPTPANPIPKLEITPGSDTEGGGVPVPPPAWGCTVSAPTNPTQPQIFILDDSCSVYNSSNGGNNFCTTVTPAPTIGDNWIAMSVPTNDAASPVPSVMALFDEDVAASYNPAIFDSTRGGVQVIQRGQTPLTAPIRNYSKGTVGVNFLSGELGGAISSNGTILVAVSQSDSIATAYPRISSNFGVTFSDVTGLPIGQQWTCACFSQGAAVMYIHQYQSHIQKSTDGGNTWTSLSASPTFPSTHGVIVPGLTQKSMKIYCSKNGQVVAGVDWGGQFYISRDGGTTWNHFDFPSTNFGAVSPNNVASGDFGMSTDGTRILVSVGYIIFGTPNVNKAAVLLSTNSGVSFTDISSSVLPQFGTGGLFSHCSISPDGKNLLVGCDVTGQIATSTDFGSTWVASKYTVNPQSNANNQNSYILPAGSIF